MVYLTNLRLLDGDLLAVLDVDTLGRVLHADTVQVVDGTVVGVENLLHTLDGCGTLYVAVLVKPYLFQTTRSGLLGAGNEELTGPNSSPDSITIEASRSTMGQSANIPLLSTPNDFSSSGKMMVAREVQPQKMFSAVP